MNQDRKGITNPHPSSSSKTWLRRLSIRTRLILIIAGMASAIVVGGGYLIVKHDLRLIEEQLSIETTAVTKVLAQDFTRLILLDTPDIASDIVAKLKAFPMIQHADVYTKDGRHALRFSPQPELIEQHLKSSLHKLELQEELFEDEHFLVSKPIQFKRSELGHVEFVISTDKLQYRIESIYYLILLMLPGILLLTFFAAYVLQRSFSAPLMSLAEASEQVSREGDYSLRLKVNDHSEFGQLFSGFNHMLDTVEKAHSDLAHQRNELQTMLESIPDGVITTDQEGKVTYMNSVAEQLTGQSQRQALGTSIRKLFRLISTHEGRVMENPVYQCLSEGSNNTTHQECDLQRHDSSKVGIKVSAAPISNENGDIVATIAVLVDVTLNRAMADELSFQASHDALTNLPNRRAFEHLLGASLEGAHQRKEEHVLMYMDLDQFKVVNDTCGHAAGDHLLKELSALLKTKIRSGDCLARLGGDEFGVILMHCPIDRAELIAQEILSLVTDYRFSWEAETFSVGISIGIAIINADSTDTTQLLAHADSACYQAKDAGRHRMYIYQDDDEALNRRRGDMAFVSRLRKIIDEERMEIFCQQIHALAPDHPTGEHYEILLRTRDDDGTLVGPGQFIPAAERYGLIEHIDAWVIRNVLKLLSEHPSHLAGLETCSINLSGVSISQSRFVDNTVSLIKKYADIAPKLCFEITETAAIGNMNAVKQFMTRLQELGVRFSLDDFGTGMSSLSYLKSLPVDYVKIDGVFIRDILDDPIDWGMVRAINELAHVMGKATVAEYVNREESLTMLQSIGVDYAQGYLLGEPVPLEKLVHQQ